MTRDNTLFRGWKHSEEAKKKIALASSKRKRSEIERKKQGVAKKGSKNPMWKDGKLSRTGLHSWIRRNKPKPERCEICNFEKPLDVANVSGTYKRELSDFQWLCRRCHMKSDGRFSNLKQFKGVKYGC